MSPLGYKYRWRVGIGLEAALEEECATYVGDHDFLWRASRVPSIQLAASVLGELEAIIAARDRAVDKAEMAERISELGRQIGSIVQGTARELRLEIPVELDLSEWGKTEPELVGVVDIGRL